MKGTHMDKPYAVVWIQVARNCHAAIGAAELAKRCHAPDCVGSVTMSESTS